MPLSNTKLLAELLVRKHEVLVQLRELGRRQLELIDGGDLTQLLKVLATKQRLLAGLHTLQQQLKPFNDQQPRERIWPDEPTRERSAELARSCEVLLREIVQQEKESESRMVSHREEAAARLVGAQAAFEARGAYTADKTLTAAQLDLSSES